MSSNDLIMELITVCKRLVVRVDDIEQRYLASIAVKPEPRFHEFMGRFLSFNNDIDPTVWSKSFKMAFINSDYHWNKRTVTNPEGSVQIEHGLTLNALYESYLGFIGEYYPRSKFVDLLRKNGKKLYRSYVPVHENYMRIYKTVRCVSGLDIPVTCEGVVVSFMPLKGLPWQSDYWQKDLKRGREILAKARKIKKGASIDSDALNNEA